MYTNNYSNRERFDKVIVKIKWCSFILPHGVHLVTRGHVRSRDKDGGHNIRSAVSENPVLHANFIWLYVLYRTGVIVDESFTLRE